MTYCEAVSKIQLSSTHATYRYCPPDVGALSQVSKSHGGYGYTMIRTCLPSPPWIRLRRRNQRGTPDTSRPCLPGLRSEDYSSQCCRARQPISRDYFQMAYKRIASHVHINTAVNPSTDISRKFLYTQGLQYIELAECNLAAW